MSRASYRPIVRLAQNDAGEWRAQIALADAADVSVPVAQWQPLMQAVAALPEAAKSLPALVLLPAEKVFLSLAQVPAAQAAQLRKAPGFVVEGQLAEPIEQLQIVAGASQKLPDEQSAAWVAAASSAWLKSAQSALDELTLRPLAFCSEASLLEHVPQTLQLLATDHGWVASGGDFAGAIAREDLSVMLPLIVARAEERVPIARLVLHAPQEDASVAEAALAERLAFEFHACTHPLAVLARRWAALEDAPYDLQPASAERVSPRARWLRIAAAALVLWCGAQMTMEAVLWQQASAQAEDSAMQMRTRLAHHPSVATMDAAALSQWVNARRQTGGQSGVGAMLARVAQAFAQAKLPQPQLSGLRFEAQEARLSLQVTAADFSVFERYREALSQAGMEASVATLTREAANVRGVIDVAVP